RQLERVGLVQRARQRAGVGDLGHLCSRARRFLQRQPVLVHAGLEAAARRCGRCRDRPARGARVAMSADVAARLRMLAQDHHDGRLDLAAYRALRAPLLDSLVLNTAIVASAMEITQPRGTVRPANDDATTRPGKPGASTGASTPTAAAGEVRNPGAANPWLGAPSAGGQNGGAAAVAQSGGAASDAASGRAEAPK